MSRPSAIIYNQKRKHHINQCLHLQFSFTILKINVTTCLIAQIYFHTNIQPFIIVQFNQRKWVTFFSEKASCIRSLVMANYCLILIKHYSNHNSMLLPNAYLNTRHMYTKCSEYFLIKQKYHQQCSLPPSRFESAVALPYRCYRLWTLMTALSRGTSGHREFLMMTMLLQ